MEDEKILMDVDADNRTTAIAPLSRRALLQSFPAVLLAPAALTSHAHSDHPLGNQRRLRIDRRFALFPIRNDAPSRRVQVTKNGQMLRSFTASLGLPADWWAHLDVSAWEGQVLTMSVALDDEASAAVSSPAQGAIEKDNAELIAAIRTSTDIWSPQTLYKERLRPLFHFSTRRGWSNDPNGLVYHAGKYHMFYQHNPYGVRWGNMHWGHAVSADLVHWKELPIALYPRGKDDFPFSGSGVIDHGNTSGWAQNGRSPMVIAFTSTGRGECIAYSQDEGATWKEFEGNPVIKHSGRDPKLIWHAETTRWVMAVYSERPGNDAEAARQGVAFYTSADLKSWEERSWIEGYYECPDLFSLPVDGDKNRIKWVLTCAVGYYSIGDFDGSRFVPESPRLPAPEGASTNFREGVTVPLFSAAQTFDNHPQGHRVQVAWFRVKAEDAPFTQMMSIPTTLSLKTTPEGVRLCREPVESIRSLRYETYDLLADSTATPPLRADLRGEAWDIEAVVSVGAASGVKINIGDDEFSYQLASQILVGQNGAMRIPIRDGRLHLRILVDRTTVEIFGGGGEAYGLFIRKSPCGNVPLVLRTMWGRVRVEKFIAHSLRSTWLESTEPGMSA